jgi:hypothetical protein
MKNAVDGRETGDGRHTPLIHDIINSGTRTPFPKSMTCSVFSHAVLDLVSSHLQTRSGPKVALHATLTPPSPAGQSGMQVGR